MLQKFPGVAGILRCDQAHLAQQADSPKSDVLQISNRRSNQIQGTHGHQGSSQVKVRKRKVYVSGSRLSIWARPGNPRSVR